MSIISIIIPSRDRESYSADLLNDLRSQTLCAEEIIIVDQSETPYDLDGGEELVHITDSGMRGPCRARNLGLERCRGEIIVFLDDDIRIEPNFLQELCGPILARESQAVVGAMCDANGRYPNTTYPFWKKEYRDWLLALTANLDFPGVCPTMSFAAGCAAIHRSVYEKIGGFDPFFDPDGAGEDREYALRLFHNGYSTLFNGHAMIRHLAAVSGGRRSVARDGLSPLEKNCIYIVAKYFGEKVFSSYSRNWLQHLFRRHLTLNPITWRRGYSDWASGRRWVEEIRTLKNRTNGIEPRFAG